MPGRYINIEETKTKLEIINEQYSNICKLIPLPNLTYEGRESLAIKIRAGTRAIRHGVLLIGGVHAREWGSTDILIYFVESILAAYQQGTDLIFGGKNFAANEIRNTLESIDLFVFPLVNPDGKAFSFSQNINSCQPDYSANEWRKNRAPTSNPLCPGVDINRNYDWLWDYRKHFHPEASHYCYGGLGVLDDPDGDGYHGTGAFSESETRNVKWLLDQNPNIRFFVDVHCFGGKILHPWGDDGIQYIDPSMNFTNSNYDGLRGLPDGLRYSSCESMGFQPLPDGPKYKEYMYSIDQLRYKSIGDEMNRALSAVRGRSYVVGPAFTDLYGLSGDSIDYVFGRHISNPGLPKIDAFLIEWGEYGEIWPNYAFQPSYEDPLGEDKMTPIILDVSASLTGLCTLADRTPMIELIPNPLSFGTFYIKDFIHHGYFPRKRKRILTFKNLDSKPIEIKHCYIESDDLLNPRFKIIWAESSCLPPFVLPQEQSATFTIEFDSSIGGFGRAYFVVTFGGSDWISQDVQKVRFEARLLLSLWDWFISLLKEKLIKFRVLSP